MNASLATHLHLEEQGSPAIESAEVMSPTRETSYGPATPGRGHGGRGGYGNDIDFDNLLGSKFYSQPLDFQTQPEKIDLRLNMHRGQEAELRSRF